MENLISIIATVFYLGMIPIFPGVWGSAFALLLWYSCKNLPLSIYLGVTAGIFFIGCLAAGSSEAIFSQKDASPIVIDEVLGIFITLSAVPKNRFSWLSGFLIFCILDGLKPFPASWIDTHLQGGLGIMLDDVVAGIYALLSQHLIRYLYVNKN